ncbi:MAG: cytochrome c [Planctomycetes bacterium]|nr:cytochrome c [Planctomycetota bacterium]
MSLQSRRGGGLLSLLFLVGGAGFLCLPFLLVERQAPSLDGADHARTLSELDVPFATAVEELAGEDPELDLRPWLGEHVDTYFGPGAARLVEHGLIDAKKLELGRELYALNCAGCHADSGDGGGPAARWLAPRPRNFRKGKFKFTSTATGERPLASDLLRTVTEGLAGSSMPSFKLWNAHARESVVEYVRYLSMRGEFEELALQLARDDEELPDPAEIFDLVRERWSPARLKRTFPAVPETTNDAASVERGRVLFNDPQRGSCFSCHGPLGRGDGPTAGDYKDDWGYPIRPRDFGAGVFRSGNDSQALYLAIATGIKGSPMGSFATMYSGPEIWDLVHFAQHIAAQGKQGGQRP